jgi:5-methylcytosine-specific restriction endonuclease McrA
VGNAAPFDDRSDAAGRPASARDDARPERDVPVPAHDPSDDLDDEARLAELLGLEPLTDPASARVLILNASFEPLHVCSVKRAIQLLMTEVAVRVEDAEAVLRTPSRAVPVPSVVRLVRYVRRPHRQKVAFNRRNLFRRDDHRCQYCGRRGSDLTLDHVQPRSRGGPTSWENVVACCRPCNARKRDRTPEEAGMALARSPKAPRFVFSSAYGLIQDVDPIWRRYLPDM